MENQVGVPPEAFGVGAEHLSSSPEAESELQSVSDDEEYDKLQYGIRQCLPIDDGEPDWEAGEAHTVEEYLRRVRYESRQLPDVVTCANVGKESELPAQGGRVQPWAAADDMPECPPDRQPSVPWVQRFLQEFAALRRRLQREQELLLVQAGGVASPTAAYAGTGEDETQGRHELQALSLDSPSALMPELTELRGVGPVHLVERLENQLQLVVQSQGLTPADSALLYALAARVERPLHGDTAALFRALLRHCARLRAELPHARDPLLPHLNVLIAIAGGYFGQDEELAVLWEDQEEY